MNSLNTTYAYTASDMQYFSTFCDNPANVYNTSATLPTDPTSNNVFPVDFLCTPVTAPSTNGNCSCQNLTTFVNAFGYDNITALLASSNDLVK